MLGDQVAISLRRATEVDKALLLRWANDEQVCARNFSSDQYALDDNHSWFEYRSAY